MGTILYVTAEVIRNVSILCQMIMPHSAQKLLDLLAVPQNKRDFSSLGDVARLSPGTSLPKPEGVFPRYIEPEGDGS